MKHNAILDTMAEQKAQAGAALATEMRERSNRIRSALILYLQSQHSDYAFVVRQLEASEQVSWNFLCAHLSIPETTESDQAAVIAHFRKRLATPPPADPFAGL